MTPATSHPRHPLAELAARMRAVSPAWGAVIVDAHEYEALPLCADAAVLGAGRAHGIEAIREGWLLHRGISRLVSAEVHADLALLMGDWCYAAGLCDVVEHGSLDDVRILADLIAEVSARAADPAAMLEERWQLALTQLVEASAPSV